VVPSSVGFTLPDRASYERAAIELFTSRLDLKQRLVVESVVRRFESDMTIHLPALIFEARRTQDTRKLGEILAKWFGKLVESDMQPSSAKQYGTVIKSILRVNRVLPPEPRFARVAQQADLML
jgi:hypothetical protein